MKAHNVRKIALLIALAIAIPLILALVILATAFLDGFGVGLVSAQQVAIMETQLLHAAS